MFLAVAGCGRLGFDTVDPADGALAELEPPPGCEGPDEDGDRWPDACDNCPVDPNSDQHDLGEDEAGEIADGVGDACDPRPALAGDFIGLVEMHNDEGAYNLYDAYSLSGTGALRLGSLTGPGSASYVSPPRVTRVDTTYTIVDSSNLLQWMGVWTDNGPNDSMFLESTWQPGLPASVWRIKESSSSGDRYSTDISGPLRLGAGQRFRVVGDTERVSGTDQKLTWTDRVTGTSVSTSLALQIPRFNSGFLEGYRAIVDFEYFVTYAVR
ncbi:MAG: hypothetical protein JWP01_187 [Myxococcales bacterium]|nr:hypothetical protein [Myxococcales bacterium]